LDRATLFMLILFSLALWGAYSIYQPFILPMVVAILLTMATSNLSNLIAKKLKSQKLATAIMAILMGVLILAPILYIATNGVSFLGKIDFNSINILFAKLRELSKGIPYLEEWSKRNLQVANIAPYIQQISLYLTKMGSKGVSFLRDIILVVLFYAIFVYYQKPFLELLKSLIPVASNKSSQMIKELSSTMEVVFYSIIVTALFEGFLFGFFVKFYDFDGLLFGVIYGFASLIPVVGGTIVWLPLSLILWSKGDLQGAITLASYSIIMISLIADTFIKPVIIKVIKEELLHNSTNVNELVIFFSIVAGMGSYGFWGMILGPAITTFLIASTKIYLEYSREVLSK